MFDKLLNNVEFYSWFYKNILKWFDPEWCHERAINYGERRSRISHEPILFPEELQVEVAGIKFSHPIGLSAGIDKNAIMLPWLIDEVGFSSVEAGTATINYRQGNPKPRLWRLEHNKIKNYMGLPNEGLEVVTDRITYYKMYNYNPIGLSIWVVDLIGDFDRLAYSLLFNMSDYIIINCSCPNVGQHDFYYEDIITQATRLQDIVNVPIFLKLTPKWESQDNFIEVITKIAGSKLNGVVLCNSYPTDNGGISGLSPYFHLTKIAHSILSPNKFIIASGGISSPEDVLTYLKSGASYCQICTSFITKGPGLLKQILFFLSVYLYTNRTTIKDILI